jgi:hypothetical protein
MKPLGSHLTNENVHSVLGFVRSAYGPHWQSPETRLPFVTISRQAGAPGADLGRLLVERLNDRDRRDIAAGARPWTLWDRELVEKVAADHHLPTSLVASLEESRPTWLGQFLSSLPSTGGGGGPGAVPNEFTVYRRVAVTIRTLAEAGRVVIVGPGGAFITRHLPMGIRIRLIAPFRDRVAATAAEQGLTHEAATRLVQEKDELRAAFLRRHWAGHALDPENFTATINTAALSPEQLVECVLPLVPAGAHVPRAPATA